MGPLNLLDLEGPLGQLESTGAGAEFHAFILQKRKGRKAQRRTTLHSRSYADGTKGSQSQEELLPWSKTLPTMKTLPLRSSKVWNKVTAIARLIITIIKIKNSTT